MSEHGHTEAAWPAALGLPGRSVTPAGTSTLPLSVDEQRALELGLVDLRLQLDALVGELRERNRPLVVDRATLVLSATPGMGGGGELRGNPVDLRGSGGGNPFRSVSVYNANPVPLYLGVSGGTGVPGVALLSVPADTLLVVPWNADDVSLGADAANLANGDVVVAVWRSTAIETSPRAYALGDMLAAGGAEFSDTVSVTGSVAAPAATVTTLGGLPPGVYRITVTTVQRGTHDGLWANMNLRYTLAGVSQQITTLPSADTPETVVLPRVTIPPGIANLRVAASVAAGAGSVYIASVQVQRVA